MFTDFFFLLRFYGVPVTVTEWLALMRGLAMGLVPTGLDDFYAVARSILVKSEAYFDQYDQAFAAMFKGIETPVEIDDEVWDWLSDPLTMPGLSDEERRLLAAALEDLDLEALQRMFEERLKEQTEAHHGGNHWVGTGGTSPFGHSGFHPGGIRVGGESRNRSAVKVAGERRYRGYRTDQEVGVRQFELALRRLRQLSSRNEGVPDELDLDETVEETASNAGRLSLVWRKSRKNAVKVLLLMDVGGSMHPYIRLCSQLFSAVNRSSHFKDLRFYYFHNCIYDWLYTSTRMTSSEAISTRRVLQELPSDYKLIVVGDAAMAPSELMARDGIIWWGFGNDEPGIEWLQAPAPPLRPLRVAQHHPRDRLGPRLRQRDHPQGARGLPHVRAHRRRAHRRHAQAHGAVLSHAGSLRALLRRTTNVPYRRHACAADTTGCEGMQTMDDILSGRLLLCARPPRRRGTGRAARRHPGPARRAGRHRPRLLRVLRLRVPPRAPRAARAGALVARARQQRHRLGRRDAPLYGRARVRARHRRARDPVLLPDGRDGRRHLGVRDHGVLGREGGDVGADRPRRPRPRHARADREGARAHGSRPTTSVSPAAWRRSPPSRCTTCAHRGPRRSATASSRRSSAPPGR